jgi:hypothetical protein
MLIHHYTTIEGLALILESRKIRFSRLDKVDDKEEATYYTYKDKYEKDANMSKYIFVSCWTCKQEESIPLWRMYTGKDMRGVRISIESEDLFPRYNIKDLASFWDTDLFFEDEETLISPEEMITEKYIIYPFPYKGILKKINYRPEHVNSIVKERGMYLINYTFPLCKKQDWSFQEEYRFVLIITPNMTGKKNNDNVYVRISNAITNNAVFTKNEQDTDLINYDSLVSDNFFSNLEITLSPACTASDRVIVESLKGKYCRSANDVKESGFISIY